MNGIYIGNIAEFRTSEVLSKAGFRHAFFTRRGGVSVGPYESLSFSVAAGDSEASVERNLERAANALGVSPARLYYLSQVHGTTALVVDADDDRKEMLFREGDALVGTDCRTAIGVRMADCLPILIGDRRTGAAAAIHAGWRGLVRGVIRSGVDALRRLSESDGDLVACIGPHITGAAFEVSDDVAEELGRASSAEDVVDLTLGPKPHVHLAKIARAQLEDTGIARDSIDVVGGCTFTDRTHFFSFRRDGKQSGRHLAAIVPRER